MFPLCGFGVARRVLASGHSPSEHGPRRRHYRGKKRPETTLFRGQITSIVCHHFDIAVYSLRVADAMSYSIKSVVYATFDGGIQVACTGRDGRRPGVDVRPSEYVRTSSNTRSTCQLPPQRSQIGAADLHSAVGVRCSRAPLHGGPAAVSWFAVSAAGSNCRQPVRQQQSAIGIHPSIRTTRTRSSQSGDDARPTGRKRS